MKRIREWLSGERKRIETKFFGDVETAARTLLIAGGIIIMLGYLYVHVLPHLLWDGQQLPLWQFVSDLYANGGAELLSIAVTVLIIERLNQRRVIRERKEALMLQMGSPANAFALEAVRLLRQEGWLEDGSLQGARLEGGSLEGAKLQDADLENAYLWGANLQGVYFWGANLRRAYLGNANLQDAFLGDTNLEMADLLRANLQNAFLGNSNLKGTALQGANLEGAVLAIMLGRTFFVARNMDQAAFDKSTILPNGKNWFPGAVWPDDFLPPDQLELLKMVGDPNSELG